MNVFEHFDGLRSVAKAYQIAKCSSLGPRISEPQQRIF